MYTYRIVKENLVNGVRSARTRTIERNRPLEVGVHLGKGYPGAYRVLELIGEGR